MNDHNLSDDLAKWPSDPYELLGIARGAPPRELRKAYTNLIRTFKPEHFPEHFRRIREAFESVQRYTNFFQSISESNASATPAADAPSASAIHSSPIPVEVQASSVERVWQLVVDGKVPEAYRQLVELIDQTPDRADVYVRLYWLCVIYPGIDSDRPAVEWLSRGLDQCGVRGLLFDLFIAEVQDVPEEVSTTRFQKLMGRTASTEQLIPLVRLRWEMLCRASRWADILEEFEQVRDRLRSKDELGWLRLLVDLVSWLAWDRTDAAATDLQTIAKHEIRSLEHLALHNSYYFDRIDLLEALIESCTVIRGAANWPTDFLELLRDGYALPMTHIIRRFEKLLQHIHTEPVRWLSLFDLAAVEGTAAINHFAQLLDEYEYERGGNRAESLPRSQIVEKARIALPGFNPGTLRSRVLRFFEEVSVAPNEILDAYYSVADNSDDVPAWLLALGEDRSLRLVCRAMRAIAT